MKFWKKAFLGILIIFIVSINICIYFVSKYSYDLNVKGETKRALREYHFIANGVYESLNNIIYQEQNAITPVVIESIIRSYANYYKTQNIFLELKQGETIFFTNLPTNLPYKINDKEITPNFSNVKIVSKNNIHYLYITGNLYQQYKDYVITYALDLSNLYETHVKLTQYLVTITIFVEIALAVVLLLFLKKLTYPIHIMQKATRTISDGNYDIRIKITGKDEFHELAENFNQMATNIQDKIYKLDKNAQDKQRLIDNLAHELRTPLTSIRGYAEYLQKANTSEKNRIIALNYIIDETDRMKNMAFKLLDIALVKNKKIDNAFFSPLELFKEVNIILKAKLKEKSINLDISSTINKLSGDIVLLRSLIINLVDNAIKASVHGSTIKLSAFIKSHPVIQVIDFGCGMEDRQIYLVCEPFYRVDEARARSSGGIGLGLSLCREIANLHAADLNIYSSKGKGTTIEIAFKSQYENF